MPMERYSYILQTLKLNNPAGIGEHSDVTGAIQEELDKIARYEDQISIINKYLKPQLHAVK